MVSPGPKKGVIKADSRANRLINLSVGESEAIALRIPMAKAAKMDLSSKRDDIRNIINKDSNTAATRSGNKYTTCVTQSFASQGSDVILAGVITRIG
jgi:hypothetical protein